MSDNCVFISLVHVQFVSPALWNSTPAYIHVVLEPNTCTRPHENKWKWLVPAGNKCENQHCILIWVFFLAKCLKYKDLPFSVHEIEVLNMPLTYLLFAAEEGSLKALPKCMSVP